MAAAWIATTIRMAHTKYVPAGRTSADGRVSNVSGQHDGRVGRSRLCAELGTPIRNNGIELRFIHIGLAMETPPTYVCYPGLVVYGHGLPVKTLRVCLLRVYWTYGT